MHDAWNGPIAIQVWPPWRGVLQARGTPKHQDAQLELTGPAHHKALKANTLPSLTSRKHGPKNERCRLVDNGEPHRENHEESDQHGDQNANSA
jgi:hypothetical protein